MRFNTMIDMCFKNHFREMVHGTRIAAVIHEKQIQNLRRTRDLLLPRMLSGQINVEAA